MSPRSRSGVAATPAAARHCAACGRGGRARDAFPTHFASAGKAILAILAFAGLAGCATMPAGQGSPDDPLEPLNRKVFAFNDALDEAVITPVAKAYLAVVPPFVRDRIRAMIDNLAEPRIFVNDVLQARVNAAGTTFARFVVNTVAGIGGMFDVASLHGLPKQTGDFGQTLYAWGVTDGPYIVLVFFGPSDVRDAFGLGVDLATTPPALVFHGHDANVASFAVGVVDGIDLYARNMDALDAIKASSLDYYTHFKSIWRQHRAATLREGRGLPPTPPELIDPGATTPADPLSKP